MGYLMLQCIKDITEHLYLMNYDLTTFQILGQKFVKFFRWYFGPNDETKGHFEPN